MLTPMISGCLLRAVATESSAVYELLLLCDGDGTHVDLFAMRRDSDSKTRKQDDVTAICNPTRGSLHL